MFIKVNSFVQDHDQFIKADVEISLIPGLPQIVFLGLPDQAIKESAHRIKNAIRDQGFVFPKAKSIIVNIRPNHFKKTSRGLELAVAFAVLYLTKQIEFNQNLEEFSFYGELTLSGEIVIPDDFLKLHQQAEGFVVLTGWTDREVPPSTLQIKTLRALASDEVPMDSRRFVRGSLPQPERPQMYQQIEYSLEQVQWIVLIAAGWHSAMIAGSAGAGKSMVAKVIHEFLEAPSPEELFEAQVRNITYDPLKWRPSIGVHHTATYLSIVGGGGVPHPGELYRSHQGVLILDEFLEFSKKVQEVLRGPMEEGVMRISRAMGVQSYPFETLVLGTSNLCPCGEWLPDQRNSCGRALYKCRAYRERLSGPVLDRFQLLFYAFPQGVISNRGNSLNLEVLSEPVPETSTRKSYLGSEVLAYLLKVYQFQSQRRQELEHNSVKNSRLSLKELQQGVSPKLQRLYFSTDLYSPRRKQALLSVARTVADLNFSMEVKAEHLEQARDYTIINFERMKSLV